MSWVQWLVLAVSLDLLACSVLNLIVPEPVMLWHRGRLALILDPCDFWVGLFYDRRKHRAYLILVPMLALRYKLRNVGRP